MVDRSIALLGTDAEQSDRIELQAGPVSATLENGSLRWVKIGGREALRAVSFLVRDSTWITANPEILTLEVDQRDDGFTVTLAVRCRTKDGAIDWRGRIEGEADGTIVFDGAARPEEDFTTCRTGFVVLHPLEGVAGYPVKVDYVDGSEENSRFPDLIDPYQTFKNIRGLSHEVLPGVRATCLMEGDAWEMEDHRNWTDASFKTYVRLLEWGYPYIIKAGEEVSQRVSLTLAGPGVAQLQRISEKAPPVTLDFGTATGTMPEVGVSLPARRLDEAEKVVGAISSVRPAFFHCRVNPSAGEGAELLGRYKKIADAAGIGIALEVLISSGNRAEEEMRSTAQATREADVRPVAVAALPSATLIELAPGLSSDKAAIDKIPAAARSAFPDIPLGGGVFGFFTELNRNPPPMEQLDFVTHITAALVHHEDDASVMETPSAIGAVIRSARALSGGKPHWLGPANMALDDNPYGSSTPNSSNRRVTMARMDPRQRGVFGAAWLIGYAAAAVAEGADALITCAPAGELGLAYAKTEYAQPYFDDLDAEAVYPIYHIVRAISQAAGSPCVKVSSSDPHRVAALSYQDSGSRILWLANLTDRDQPVTVPVGWTEAMVRVLDADCFGDAIRDRAFFDDDDGKPSSPFVLGSYAVARFRLGADR